jgi:sialate O-acetylesterase
MSLASSSRPPAPTEEKRCIVSLTYDDALPCHFESVAPLLEEHGLHGTFYVPCGSSLFDHAASWREVATQGHELGNHTVFHPTHNRAPVDDVYDLSRYTARRWTDEVRLANAILGLLDERSVRSFGHTCSRNVIGQGDSARSFDEFAPDFFIAARGLESPKPVDLGKINWFNLATRNIDQTTFEQLHVEIGRMCLRGGWLILNCHGVGARDHKRHIDEDEHTRLIEWLANRQDAIWTAPVRVVAEALKPSRRALAQAAAKT